MFCILFLKAACSKSFLLFTTLTWQSSFLRHFCWRCVLLRFLFYRTKCGPKPLTFVSLYLCFFWLHFIRYLAKFIQYREWSLFSLVMQFLLYCFYVLILGDNLDLTIWKELMLRISHLSQSLSLLLHLSQYFQFKLLRLLLLLSNFIPLLCHCLLLSNDCLTNRRPVSIFCLILLIWIRIKYFTSFWVEYGWLLSIGRKWRKTRLWAQNTFLMHLLASWCSWRAI